MPKKKVERTIVRKELIELSEKLGRPATFDEWKATYHHGAATCQKWGGFVAVREEALGGSQEYETPDLPTGELPIDELIAERKRLFECKAEAEAARRLIPVKIKTNKPVALWLSGDWHIDGDGTDLTWLEHDIRLVDSTPGMFASFLGDARNAWVGNLARLYAEDSSSARDGVRLMEHYLSMTDWLFVALGNHDLWSGATEPISRALARTKSICLPVAVRIALQFPNKRSVRVNARHDYGGTSQWNPSHAVMKAAQLGWRDNILTCGHKHKSGYSALKDPATEILSHCAQVASYKLFDIFARDRGFPDQFIAPYSVFIINPQATSERELIQHTWCLEYASDYLTFLRKRK